MERDCRQGVGSGQMLRRENGGGHNALREMTVFRLAAQVATGFIVPMKAILFAWLALVVGVQAQGTLTFANTGATRLTNRAGVNFPPPGNSTYVVGLYWGIGSQPATSLQLLPASSNGVTGVWAPLAGIFIGSTATFPVPSGTQISVQVRIWNKLYSDWETARMNQVGDLADYNLGASNVGLITLGTAGSPQSLTSPTGLGDVGMQRFVTDPVPEPGTWTLCILASLTLLFFGRRRSKPVSPPQPHHSRSRL